MTTETIAGQQATVAATWAVVGIAAPKGCYMVVVFSADGDEMARFLADTLLSP